MHCQVLLSSQARETVFSKLCWLADNLMNEICAADQTNNNNVFELTSVRLSSGAAVQVPHPDGHDWKVGPAALPTMQVPVTVEEEVASLQ